MLQDSLPLRWCENPRREPAWPPWPTAYASGSPGWRYRAYPVRDPLMHARLRRTGQRARIAGAGPSNRDSSKSDVAERPADRPKLDERATSLVHLGHSLRESEFPPRPPEKPLRTRSEKEWPHQ